MHRCTIDKFEVSTGNAVSSGRASAAVTVCTAWFTLVSHLVVVIIHRTV